MARVAFVGCLFILSTCAVPQPLPIVKANSPIVDIQDGNRTFHGIWNINPASKLETYFARRAASDRTLTFRTDIDSIRFRVHPGKTYDFAVLLKNKGRCLTRISALNLPVSGQATIPFAIGPDNKIYVEGTIDGSRPLRLMLDTGAYSLILYPSGVAKGVHLRNSKPSEMQGTGGSIPTEVSDDNRFRCGGLAWEHESVTTLPRQSDQADGIVSLGLFENKVLLFDFDAGQLSVFDSAPTEMEKWPMQALTFEGTLPAIVAHFETESSSFDQLVTLDLGSGTGVQLNGGAVRKFHLPGGMKPLGSIHMGGIGHETVGLKTFDLARLGLGLTPLTHVPINLETGSNLETSPSGHAGIDILKRFNLVLDLQKNRLYFKPNHLFSTPYRRDYESRRPIVLGILGVLLAAALGVSFLKMKKNSAAFE